MNNCSCVYVGPEEDGNEFLKEKMVVAKKDYKCGECHNVISIGEKYEYVSGKWDGSFLLL